MQPSLRIKLVFILITASLLSLQSFAVNELLGQENSLDKSKDVVRFASFNISFNRRNEGDLKKELSQAGSKKPNQIAEIIQRVRPDIVLLNEFDFDSNGEALIGFQKNYLGVSQNGQDPIQFKYSYTNTVNTGVDSGLDLNRDSKTGTPNDAFGFGFFPGQYGMVVLSNFEIDTKQVRTFQKFLWKDMPNNLIPKNPGSHTPYYPEAVMDVFRLSSKSHWDIPIKVNNRVIHFLCAHPTPPVFDGEEDRNGCRNHDEIRLFVDYVMPEKSDYIYDDSGKTGGLTQGAHFVIAGDMNADANDGDSSNQAARQLTQHPLIDNNSIPESTGGAIYARTQAGKNNEHRGNPAQDTGDFNDSAVGNLRLDYCLPSKNLEVVKMGVYWPAPKETGADLVTATDHRMVWIDIVK